MAGPQVEVVAVTHFRGVRPERAYRNIALGQDQGSDCARLIECAGRTCYDSYGRGRNSKEYAQHILSSGHGSVLEHASISFFISGISRGCSHEWVRHRVGTAVSQRSTRYVDESESEWAWHPLFGVFGDAYQATRDSMVTLARETYRTLFQGLERVLLDGGVDKSTARKQARGAARGALGNALSTEMVWTANIRALRHIIGLRATDAADAEIRLLANRIFERAQEVCPEYFSDFSLWPAKDGIGSVIEWRASEDE